MQRKFADLLVFNEGHRFAYECAKEAGYEGDNATLRVKASQLQDPKYYPLVAKYIGDLREETYKKYSVSFGGHLAELAKIRDEAVKQKSYSAATNAEEELNKRIATIVDDNSLLIDPKTQDKPPKDKKPKPILS
jgi:hypothetical protein